jgi:hypothetical protein
MSKNTPSPAKRIAQSILGDRWYYKLAVSYCQLQDEVDSRYRASLRRLAALKNRSQGKRCFIVGNGPSLRKMDLSLLRDEVTFGMNRIYLLFDQLGFATTYYVAINNLVIEQCAAEIVKLPCPKFINWYARELIDFTDDMMFVHLRSGPSFYTDITEGVWAGATVTYVAMQIAYYLGFEQVVLVGVDHFYKTKGKPHAMVVSQGDDPNHFDPRYFGKGFRWQLPNLEASELAYRIAKYQFELADREIVDATVDGCLQVFRKVDYQTLFEI